MAITQTARLERETEETRAQLEHTLDELRARVSPGQLLDQATDYLRNSSGRAFLGNLRDEVVRNPLPVALVGAGIAWIAIAGTVGRRSNGNGHSAAGRDWGETARTADDLAHGGRGHDREPSAVQRARQAAEGWVDDARDAVAGARDTWREGAEDLGARASTAYDETVGRARETAGGWADEARSTAAEAGEAIKEGMDTVRERAAGVYDRTAGGVRRAADKAAHYGRAARHAVEPNGALINFCREQPMLVAGLGIAIGAALGAMVPPSRVEKEVMGDASRDVQDRVREAASQSLHTAVEAVGGEENREPSAMSDHASNDDTDAVERSAEQGSARPKTEGDPQSAAPYEAAEAGTAGPASNLSESEYAKRV